ncbi:hydrolase TatD [candidate division SR1 bacterium]|nr:hydrolase TatD [candidate division SR1 bacterium]
MLVDAHTHINFSPLFEDWRLHLQAFQDAGGKILINAGAHQAYNENGVQIAKEAKTFFPDLIVKATVGIHPDDIDIFLPGQMESPEGGRGLFLATIQQLRTLAISNPNEVVAIGECGIDLHGDDAKPLKDQQEMFRLHCELARELGLPIVIHSRSAFSETLEILKDFTDLKIYFHCFGYGPEEIAILEERFPELRIGFTNIITYKNAQSSRDALLSLKKAKILTETDAPWLPPQAFRGQMNYPHYVSYVVEKIAELLEVSTGEVKDLVEQNVRDLFDL